MEAVDSAQNSNPHTSTGGSNPPESDVLTLRALIPMREAGVVIGKQGSNIRQIREESGARVSVSPHVPGLSERILSVQGTEEAIAKAYANIARNLNQGDLRGTSHEAVESTPLTIRFLVPNSRMGGLIGKNGSRIKSLQEESNARLTAIPTPLPNSGDRILEMVGVPDAIHIATYHACRTLKNLNDRPCYDRQYRPENAYIMQQPHLPGMQPGVGASGMVGHHGVMQQHNGPHNQSPLAPHMHNAPPLGMHPAQHAGSAGGAFRYQSHVHHDGAMETRKFVCPAHKVGPLIGKNGLRINRVRTETSCKISIEDASENPNERIFTVTGFIRNVETAIRLLDAQLRRELSRDADAAANATAVAAAAAAGGNAGIVSDTAAASM